MTSENSEHLTGRSYLLLNALVWVFSIALMLLAKIMLRDVTGLGTVSVALPVGFTLVSIFDYIYNRLSSDAHDRAQTP